MPRVGALRVGQIFNGGVTGTLVLDLRGSKSVAGILKELTSQHTSLDVHAPHGAGAEARVAALVSTLLRHPTLQVLQIRALGQQLQQLAVYLTDPTCGLKAINLSECVLKDEGAVALAKMLTVNQSITACDLSSNGIELGGSTALLQALKVNQSICAMNLDGNPCVFRASSKNPERQVLNWIQSESRWNMRIPLSVEANNELRHQTVMLLQAHGLHDIPVLQDIVALVGRTTVSDMKLEHRSRMHLLLHHKHLKMTDAEFEVEYSALIKKCVPFTFSNTATSTTKRITEATGLNHLFGGFFGAGNEYLLTRARRTNMR